MRFVRWIVGAVLSFYGITLVVGCIAYLASGESKTSIWVDLGLVTAFGVVPLAGGIMLLLMRPPPFNFLGTSVIGVTATMHNLTHVLTAMRTPCLGSGDQWCRPVKRGVRRRFETLATTGY
jgi:hypothetical protein